MDELFSKKKKEKIASLSLWVKLNAEKLVSRIKWILYAYREGFKVVIFLSFNTFSNIFFNFPFLSLLIVYMLFLLCEIYVKWLLFNHVFQYSQTR